MRRSMMTLLLLAGSALGAFAQTGEISVSAGASKFRNESLGSLSALEELKVKSDFRIGFRFTINQWSHFGHELGYAYNHGSLDEGSAGSVGMPIHQGMYNFLAYATPEGSKIRPFATGGVHFSTFYPPGTGVFSGNGFTKFGYNYGGGVKFRVTDTWLARIDVRDYATAKPDFGLNPSGWLHQLEVSAGVGFAF
ncbi:MAG: outer membrane protein [Acidobacteriota bacterium]